MSPKELLAQCIPLLYWELKLPDQPLDSRSIVKTLIEKIKLPETVIETDMGRENITQLRYLVEWMLEVKEPLDELAIKQRLKLSIVDEPDLYDTIAVGLEEGTTEEIVSRCNTYLLALKEYFNYTLFEEKIKEIMKSTIYSHGRYDIRLEANNIIESLSKFTMSIGGQSNASENPLVVKAVDFNDKEMALKRIQEAIIDISPEGIMVTGYKGLNQALGIGGLIRGDCYLIGARRGKNKSGFTMDICLDVAHHNTPYMLNPTKKPLILHITCENSSDQNTRYVMDRCYFFKHGAKPNYSEVEPEYLLDVVQEYVTAKGYNFKELWIPGGTANYLEIQQIVRDFEAEGYEIHVLCIDYLALLDKSGLENVTAGSEIRDLFRKMRNFCNPKKITLITPHQVSSEATNLVRAGEPNLVEKIVGLDYYDGSRRLTQEIDCEVIIDIVAVKDCGHTRYYQTAAVGKNRAVRIMPEAHKSFAMEFTSDWGLIPDFGKDEKHFIQDIGSIRRQGSSDGGEEDW